MRSARCCVLAIAFFLTVSLTTAEAKGPRLTTQIAEVTVSTWKCQDQLGVARTRAAQEPWSLPRSSKYRAWVLNLWKTRHHACLEILHQRASTWRRLEQGLAGSPMAGTARELEAAGRRHGVSPYFIAAIAATESSLGAAMCGNFNAWGLGNCTGIWNVPAFRSWGEAYDYMARFLKGRWPSARTTYDFGGYAACSSCWGAKTESHMRRLFGVSNSVRY